MRNAVKDVMVDGVPTKAAELTYDITRTTLILYFNKCKDKENDGEQGRS